MKLYQKQALFTQNVATLLKYIHNQSLSVTFGEAYRTREQAKLYAASGKGIVNSLHCKRLAVDLNLFDLDGNYLTKKSDYKPFGDFWKSLDPNNRWGGDWVKLVDSGHFEKEDK